MKEKITKRVRLGIALVYFSFSLGCEDFLVTQPYGTTTMQTLSAEASGAEALLIAAYSNLDGVSTDSWNAGASNWIFGSIAGGDAYKGSDPIDQSEITPIEIHFNLVATNSYLEVKWVTYYNGIARSNDAIKAYRSLPEKGKDFRGRIAEARFLRGFYHFELRKIFGWVPYIDETMEDTRVGNAVDILPKIQEDFFYATAYLPLSQEQPGRITKSAAQAYYGISKMWKPADYGVAKIYFDSVIQSGRYKLNETYHENFNADFRNTTESILEVQQSVNDGGQGYNGNFGDVLNYVLGGPGGCCGFHQPSQNLVNAFKTDSFGLPLLDDYNNSDVTNDEGVESGDNSFTPYTGTLDPRLDWTVGRRDIPYLDWGKHPGREWIRDQVHYGPYSAKKYTLHQSHQEEFSDKTGWYSGLPNINNLKLLRYADLLLYAAEAEVELDNLSKAQELVDQVRTRAAKPAGWVHTYIDPNNPSLGFTDVPAANYFINPYPPGHFTAQGKDYARKAVRFERRLELGMEGYRFFDLVRWGIAAVEKNKYFDKEKEKRTYMTEAKFVEGINELLPIPKKAIDLSYKSGIPTLRQNPGY